LPVPVKKSKMNCKIAIYLLHLSFIGATWSNPLPPPRNPELGPYFEGDIILTEEELKSGMKFPNYLWPGGVMPFKIAPGFTDRELALIKEAQDVIQQNTCIKLPEATDDDKDFVVYTKNLEGSCSSYPGYFKGQAHPINLAAGCFNVGFATAMHETIHALGFNHEQSRPDRDQYVRILFDKINPKNKRNFEIDPNLSETYGVPYDYDSVMHYPKDAFAKVDGETVIVTYKDPSKQDVIGQRDHLSKGDALKLNRMYKCPE
jgi:hypothetical protein